MHQDRSRMYGEFDKMINEFDRFFDSLATGARYLGPHHHSWTPPTDVYEAGGRIVVRIEIAGMKQEDFEVSYDNGLLTVAGSRHDPADKVAYHRLEISYGDFMTQVHMPWPVDEEAIEAKYDRGFLFITLPRQKVEQTRIPVTVIESDSE